MPAAMPTDSQNRLQPALLDRLTDEKRSGEGEDFRIMSKAQLRQAVLRDLRALFNAVQPLRRELEADPVLADSVLNFGLPSLAGRLASDVDIGVLEADIRRAIVRFEPRILADTLVVRALEAASVLDTHNVIELEIRGHLWSQPVPLEILLRTRLNLEAGQIDLRDASRASAAGPTRAAP
jgi:type VI secretion system protein ImpF